MKRSSTPITMRVGHREFIKVNATKYDWRDIYHFILTLSWPQFAGLVLGIYVFINLCFAMLYLLGGRCIAGLVPGSFSDAFFFSVETLATVGYGHAYPDTLYGHCVATLEIMVGLFGLAVMTGLIFVRFSRPTARIKFSEVAVGARTALCSFKSMYSAKPPRPSSVHRSVRLSALPGTQVLPKESSALLAGRDVLERVQRRGFVEHSESRHI